MASEAFVAFCRAVIENHCNLHSRNSVTFAICATTGAFFRIEIDVKLSRFELTQNDSKGVSRFCSHVSKATPTVGATPTHVDVNLDDAHYEVAFGSDSAKLADDCPYIIECLKVLKTNINSIIDAQAKRLIRHLEENSSGGENAH